MTDVIALFHQGLRFSGVNDTDYRVYLLGNPVSSSEDRFIISFRHCCLFHTCSFLTGKCWFSGGLVDKSGQFGTVCHHGGRSIYSPPKRLLIGPKKTW